MFQPLHLAVLLSACILVPLVCNRFKDMNLETVNWFIKCCAVVALFFDPVYWIWEVHQFGRVDFSTTLPLYICSLFWILLPIVAFGKPGFIKQTATACICTFCMVGGVLGFVFNIYLNQYPFFTFVPLRSLLYHFLMILVSSVMWSSGFYQVQKGDWFRSAIPVAILIAPCVLLNRIFGWDYCYTAGGIGTPLEHISAAMPKVAFLILLYGGLFLFIRFIFYGRIRTFFMREKANTACLPEQYLDKCIDNT
ncbi:TMEM164 family acyltransferase [Anaerotignum sp.]|uniref:TMEM164 family acyltransferase n=1 Tax=Anaerotignum sp. TaxID=2039241 RepID=UPI0028A7E584|nr:YwaF family protein [Anaerotignum sp.]